MFEGHNPLSDLRDKRVNSSAAVSDQDLKCYVWNISFPAKISHVFLINPITTAFMMPQL